MSIRFDCVGCNKKIVVHDRFEGKNVRCPSCSYESVVPKKLQLREQQLQTPDDLPPVTDTLQTVKSALSSLPSLESSPEVASNEAEPAATSKPKKNRRSRSIRKEHGGEEKELEWDITPMVDVAFLLLIFFMLTASFSIQKVIRTSAPQSDQPSSAVQVQVEEKVENLIVQVDEFNAYTVVMSDGQTNEASSKQELIAILKDARARSGDQLPRIVIQAHVDSFHGTTVGCMDAAREAEFTSFQLLAVESFD